MTSFNNCASDNLCYSCKRENGGKEDLFLLCLWFYKTTALDSVTRAKKSFVAVTLPMSVVVVSVTSLHSPP
ncbi:MAG TPA: hypothetical protein DEQ14_00660 [Treponema sp.]|nr:hypothetical protein [Treponema sp.]